MRKVDFVLRFTDLRSFNFRASLFLTPCLLGFVLTLSNVSSSASASEQKDNQRAVPSIQTTGATKNTVAETASEAAKYINKGIVEANREQFEQALADINHGLALNPQLGSAEVYDARRKALSDAGKWTPALDDASRVIKLEPSNGWYYRARGQLYCQMHKDKLAINDFVKATQLMPKYVWTYLDLAQCYEVAGLFQKSIDSYSAAIRLEPKSAPHYLARASAYEKMGRKDLAKKDRDTAAKLAVDWNTELFPGK